VLFRLLGPFEVAGPRGPITISSARQRAVLATLALHAGRPVPVARLVDAVWPDNPPASARNSLQSHVARLRSVLGDPGLIVLEPAGYRLVVPPDQVDALRFEALTGDRAGAAELDEALALWRGPPLPEFPDEPFAGRAARLTEAHRNTLARRADLLVADGHAGDAAARLAEPVDADPCWERGALTRARALAAAGRSAEAAAVLRRHSDAVVDLLGMDPSAAVRRLQVALLRGEIGSRGELSVADAGGTAEPAGTGTGRADPSGAGTTDPRISPAAAQRPGPDADAAGPRREPAGRVPLRFSSFVGRDAEQAELAKLLADPGLVAVVGPGGVGKTRLVAETVRAASRIAWVDAADVRGADDLRQAVAVAVGAAVAPGADPVAAVAEAAARWWPLIVLDNCEHLVDAAAELVEALSGAGVRIVVTSRERLRADGERVLTLGPLESAAGVRLFRDRAGDGVGTDDPAVAEIVSELDGLPLAIELAATQAAVLGVAEVRGRLEDRLDLLTRGRRTADARHRTLRAVLDWSFRLLDDEERLTLWRLAVFAGGFTVALAEAVVADERLPRARVAAVIAALVDRSLVARHGPRRYRLLETVRAYAAGPEAEGVRARHAAAMVTAAEELAERLLGPDQAGAVGEIEALLPDLRSAVSDGDDETVGRIAGALYRYGYRRQHYEVLAWGRHARRPEALAAAANHAWGRGDLALAEQLARQALAAAPDTYVAHEVLGDVALVACDPESATAHYRALARIGGAIGRPAVEASGLVGEVLVLAYSGSSEPACRLAETALELADASGNPSARAEARYGLGEALADTDPPRALALLDEAAALAGAVQDRLFEAAAETAAVAIRSRHGDPAAALTSFRAVLALWRRAGNDLLQAAALRNLVVLLARVGADETAALVDAALPPSRLYAAERARLDRARAAVAERLGPDRLAAVRRRAERMPAAAVVDAALETIDAALRRPAG
jgi:predicted ATPase/DNA-binding SARP family transcriptional activator